jgi:hypothetical protein
VNPHDEPRPEALVELEGERSMFIGFKLDSGLRRQLESLSGPDRKYVSREDSTILRICRLGDDHYVGKLIHERLTTDRVNDIRRNVASILQRVCPDTRLPAEMEILPGPPAAVTPQS